MWMWLVLHLVVRCCGGVSSSFSEREEREVEGEEGEKRAINFCASLDLGLRSGVVVVVVVIVVVVGRGDACASQSVAGSGPNLST